MSLAVLVYGMYRRCISNYISQSNSPLVFPKNFIEPNVTIEVIFILRFILNFL